MEGGRERKRRRLRVDERERGGGREGRRERERGRERELRNSGISLLHVNPGRDSPAWVEHLHFVGNYTGLGASDSAV